MNWSWIRDRLWPTVGHLNPEDAKRETNTRLALYDPDLFDLAAPHSSDMLDEAVDHCKQLLDLDGNEAEVFKID